MLEELVFISMKTHDPCNPGEVLSEYIQRLELTIDQAAEAMDIPTWKLTAILMTRTRIDAELAARLALAFGTTAAYWLNLQHQKDMCDVEKIYRELSDRKTIQQLYDASEIPEALKKKNNIHID